MMIRTSMVRSRIFSLHYLSLLLDPICHHGLSGPDSPWTYNESVKERVKTTKPTSEYSSDPKMFECTHCDKKYRTRDSVYRHFKKEHPEGDITPFNPKHGPMCYFQRRREKLPK